LAGLDPQDALVRSSKVEVDQQLVLSVAAGSSDALAALYDRHAETVFALARRVLNRLEDAEEVVQDVFSQVWRDAPKYEPHRATVAGWIVMLARTRAIDRLRARRARPDQAANIDPQNQPDLVSGEKDPEQTTIAGRDAEAVRGALRRLPETQRGLIELAYYEGLTQSEIAARTGLPLGTVKTRIRTAMASLLAVLQA
jgi:RNA polymerase sigma-70 factor (ECF subfamily)